ncbi:hypothetical protein CYY_003026 [Polysphondylium violaceum]|uniref:Uncharacterized protein n=1 Tax=Polysphondylium violaceum TaxID=133409 RepID=A0A8J4PX85_9MYCE|nr:hypothetical protein CYY_003026 [Polysphondylium violaceum]
MGNKVTKENQNNQIITNTSISYDPVRYNNEVKDKSQPQKLKTLEVEEVINSTPKIQEPPKINQMEGFQELPKVPSVLPSIPPPINSDDQDKVDLIPILEAEIKAEEKIIEEEKEPEQIVPEPIVEENEENEEKDVVVVSIQTPEVPIGDSPVISSEEIDLEETKINIENVELPEEPTIEEIKQEQEPIDVPNVFTRERLQTRAEAELLNLFAKNPINLDDANAPQPYAKDDGLSPIAEHYQDLPKKSRKGTLSKKFFATFSRKKSRKIQNGEDPFTSPPLTSNKEDKLSIPPVAGELPITLENNNNNNFMNDPVPGTMKKKKYHTISYKMATIRKKLFAEEKKIIEEEMEKAEKEDAEAAEKKEEVKKKKSFFSSHEFAHYGAMVSKEIGHVFMLSSPSGYAYSPYI